MMATAPRTRAPAAVATATVSRVDPPGRDDVFHDEDTFGWRQRESSSQHEHAVLALGEQRPHMQRATNLLADDDAPQRWRENGGRLEVPGTLGQRGPEPFGKIRILQHERALQISVAVQAGRQPEMPVEQCAGMAEQIENVGVGHSVVQKTISLHRRTSVKCAAL